MFKTILKKRNNKGFSLVELIVVILIMAIIAVALAPQVIKWVSTASENTKKNNESTLKATIQTCVADYMGTHASTSIPAEITVKVTGTDVTLSSENEDLKELIKDALASNDDSNSYTFNIAQYGASVKTTSGE